MTEEALFHEALARTDPAERAVFLDANCPDPGLRARVEALLAAHGQPTGVLEWPAAAGAHTPGPDDAAPSQASAPPAEGPGARIGPYKLLQRLGEGGMGAVFMAEQERPVRRMVALKVIKPGMDSAQVVARFEAERQALALMDHPNIAKVLDAGTTPAGRPYFVMELVKGVPITKYCDDAHLTPRERLGLFIPVCQAIQHAHQKGVIHRDVKPSNVMVALYDGKPVPKVIDFGVAKALHQKLTDRTVFTEFGQVVGTLEYMSPEQAELNQLDIDTRSDIYALGVLLYELLTGTTPFDRKRLLKAAYDEVLRIIREEEPPKPSTRLSGSADLPSIAASRRTEPRRLGRLVSGDLDWVVMRCLEKDRARRYETANGLAADLQRYLADEPVLAGPPSARYRLQKFLRRHKIAVLAAAGIALALVTGIVGTTIGLVRATAAERLANERLQRAEQAEAAAAERRNAAVAAEAKAVREAAIARAVNSFLQQDLLQMADAEVQLASGLKPDSEIKLRTLLERAESRVRERFADQPEVEAAVRQTLGKAFNAVGEYARAVDHLAKVRAYREAQLGPDHPDTLASILDLADALQGTNRLPEAVPLSEETFRRMKTALGPDDVKTLRSMFNLAWAYLNVGRRQESLALFEETHRLMRAKLGPDHPLTLNCLRDMSLAYTNLDRRAEAVLMREEALRLTKARLGPSHPSTLVATFWLAMAYLQADRVNDAIQLCAENLKLDRAVLGADHPETLRTLHLLAMALRRTDRFAEALPLEEEAWRLSKAKSGADHYDTLWYQSGLAHSYLLAKQPEKALPLYQEYLIRESIRLKADEPGLAAAQSNVGRVLLKFEQFTEAEKVLRACLALCQKLQPDVWTTFDTQTLLGGSLLGQKKYAEAEPLLVQGYEGMKAREAKIPLASKNYLAEAVERLVRLYEATGRPEKAQEWRAKLPPAGPGGPPPS